MVAPGLGSTVGRHAVELLHRKEVEANHLAIAVEQQELLIVPLGQVLQLLPLQHGNGAELLAAADGVSVQHPETAVVIDKHIVELTLHAIGSKHRVDVDDKLLDGQVDTRHGVLVFEPQVVVPVEVRVVISAVVRQRVLRLQARIDVEEQHAVVKINMADGGNHHAASLCADNALSTVVRQTVRGIVNDKPTYRLVGPCLDDKQE